MNAPSWRPLYPFASHYVTLDAARLHYVDEGHGPPVLMVHGNPTWSFYWRQLIQGAGTSYRAVAVDHIGCGLSDKPQHYPYRLDQHIRNLVRLIDALDLRGTTLVAHDWGGPIGLGALLLRRDRFAGLVLLNTGAFPPPYIPWRIRACRIPWLGSWAIRRWNLFARAALRMAVADPGRLTPAVRAGLVAPYDSWHNRIAIDRFVKDIPSSPRHGTWEPLQSIEDGVANLADMPSRIVWGMRDWCFRPQCLARLERLLPDAETIRLADAGHYVMEDSPEPVVACVRTLLGQLHPGT